MPIVALENIARRPDHRPVRSVTLRRRGAPAATKCLAVLLCDLRQKTARAVAAELGVSVQAIMRWQNEWGNGAWQFPEEARVLYERMRETYFVRLSEFGANSARREYDSTVPIVLALARSAIAESYELSSLRSLDMS
jgi:Homeodomain-like domain